MNKPWRKMTVKINENGKWCTKCKKFLPFEMFYKSQSKTPYSSRCKECFKKCAIQRNIEVFGTKKAPKKVKLW